jgi:hypothetical protein
MPCAGRPPSRKPAPGSIEGRRARPNGPASAGHAHVASINLPPSGQGNRIWHPPTFPRGRAFAYGRCNESLRRADRGPKGRVAGPRFDRNGRCCLKKAPSPAPPCARLARDDRNGPNAMALPSGLGRDDGKPVRRKEPSGRQPGRRRAGLRPRRWPDAGAGGRRSHETEESVARPGKNLLISAFPRECRPGTPSACRRECGFGPSALRRECSAACRRECRFPFSPGSIASGRIARIPCR